MRNLIVVHNAYKNIDFTKQSIESMRYASHRWQCDFHEITQFNFVDAPDHIFWERLWVFENFLNYEKVLFLDADTIINSKSPNIFDELTTQYDFGAVLDGNPNGRFKHDDNWYRNHSYNFHSIHNSIEIFEKYIPNFNYKNYWDTYFNAGVFLYRPKKLLPIISELKMLLFENREFYNYMDRIKNQDIFAGNNILSAVISVYHDRLKLLDNTWNWIAPDDITEYNDDMFLGKMKPNIYHFAGTDGSKESLKTYDRWK